MSIHGITGLPGCGKSLFLSHVLRRDRGRRRFSNLFPRTGEWEFALWDDIRRCGHAIVGLDEGHSWFFSRDYSQTGQGELLMFQQHRKNGIDLWFTVQAPGQLDAEIRRLTHYWHVVKRFGKRFGIDTVYFGPDLESQARKPIYRRPFVLTPGDYAAYWTEQLVGDREGNGYDLGRLAKDPVPVLYGRRPGRLFGKELRYVEPDTVVVSCYNCSVRVPWMGDVEHVLEVLRGFEGAGCRLLAFPYALEFELEVKRERVKWSWPDYYRAGHPIAKRLYYTHHGRTWEDPASEIGEPGGPRVRGRARRDRTQPAR